MTNSMYFWVNNEVLEMSVRNNVENFRGCYCVDTEYVHKEGRYGKFSENPDHYGSWGYIPIKDFPKEFQMALLLLGVT